MSVRATLYKWVDPCEEGSNHSLWNVIANKAVQANDGCYALPAGRRKCLVVRDSRQEQQGYQYHRLLQANLFRNRGEVLLELSAANLFSHKHSLDPLSSSELPDRLQYWVRKCSSQSLDTHLSTVQAFLSICSEVGITLEQLPLKYCQATASLMDGRGVLQARDKPSADSLSAPWKPAESKSLLIHCEAPTDLTAFIGQLTQIQKQLCGGKGFISDVQAVGYGAVVGSPDALHLALVPESADFIKELDWQRWFYAMERGGKSFKVAQTSVLGDRFAMRNLIFDLFMKAGGIPWVGEYKDKRLICALDAGHHKELGLSRWVAARFSRKDHRQRIYFEDSQLAENIPKEIVQPLLQKLTPENSLVLRDGRMHRSDEQEMSKQGLQVAAINKRPLAVIYQENGEKAVPADAGAYLTYPDGSALLQSMASPPGKDYVRPLRISLDSTGISPDFMDDLLTLTRLPTLSIMHAVRLPVPVYWADLASKLNQRDWVKVLGNGWGLERLVPALRDK